MSTSYLLRGLVASATAAAVLLPATAHAGKDVHRDPAGDVASFTDESEDFSTQPDRKVGDIVRSVAKHTNTRVTFSLKMRELPKPRAVHGVFTRIVTNDKSYYADAFRIPGLGNEVNLTDRRGEVLECEGLTSTRNTKRRTITLSVPRECIGNPRWVRLGGGVFTMARGKSYVDESHRTSIKEAKELAIGPKVRRG